jgi:hypothetical protein
LFYEGLAIWHISRITYGGLAIWHISRITYGGLAICQIQIKKRVFGEVHTIIICSCAFRENNFVYKTIVQIKDTLKR